MDDVMAEAKEKNIPEDKIYDIIEKLKRNGDIFEPKRGYIQKI
jgi:DNA replicative helicase MCM subunit Mcm2 (Cdc46/Mcm family)